MVAAAGRYLLKTNASGTVSFNRAPQLIRYCWGKGGQLCSWTATGPDGTEYDSGSPYTIVNDYDVPISPRELANCTCRGIDVCPREAVYPRTITFKPASCSTPPIYRNAAVLNPACVAKYQSTLLLPPIMPRLTGSKDPNPAADQYNISVREIFQSVLPTVLAADAPAECRDGYDPFRPTRLFAYGTEIHGQSTHNWPAFTIEATRGRRVQVQWRNELFDLNRRYRPHLLADQLDQTIHWANPNELGAMGTDHAPCEGWPDGPMYNATACTIAATTKYTGPVPIVTHVHGMEGVQDNSDGYTEAWYLPNATNLAGYKPYGTWYDKFRTEAQASNPPSAYGPGLATYTYPTSQRPSQLWYHDHVLGATRLNVYTGLAGFFMIRNKFPRNGPELPGLPFPPPGSGPDSAVRELLLAIQDRAFDVNNQLYYSKQDALDPTFALPDGPVPPIWVPEFAASLPDGTDATMMMVNGRVSPRHSVAPEPYRLRVLNGCNAKALILYFSTTQPTAANPVVTTGILRFYAIGNEGGFFPSVVGPFTDTGVLMGPAERYDLIIDFSGIPAGRSVYMLNKGPGVVYDGSNVGNGTTVHIAQVMRFDVGSATPKPFDLATLNASLVSEWNKAPTTLPTTATVERQFTLLEDMAESGNPIAQFIGTVQPTTTNNVLQGEKRFWMDPVDTITGLNATEEWTIINLTPDAHPIHIHEVMFEIVRYTRLDNVDADTKTFSFTTDIYEETPPPGLLEGEIIRAPCAANPAGCRVRKDTTLMPPGYATTVRMRTANRAGLFVWHCHLLEHEDNEMMRPWCVGNPGYPDPKHPGMQMCAPMGMPMP
ncbi:hypothetical protein OEZ86_007976 [Tetradesmus obliquus]|nr:hypothetical protein OEZ86_007976 [Tetradesmus obliquus]